MPTPFYHLALAHDMLASDALLPQNKARIQAEWPAFLFGNTAPDVQSINQQKRDETHFFKVPFKPDEHAYEAMFTQHPQLRDANDLDAAHAMFMAGYCCHLWLDQRWITDILFPVFIEQKLADDWVESMFLHNVLRVHLDRMILPQLDSAVGDALAAAMPKAWVPFVADADLGQWRDFLALQLQGAEPIRTVDVFAKRMKRSPDEFETLLSDKNALHTRILQYCSLDFLSTFRTQAVAHSVQLINTYLN